MKKVSISLQNNIEGHQDLLRPLEGLKREAIYDVFVKFGTAGGGDNIILSYV